MYSRLQADAAAENSIPKTELAALLQKEMKARDMKIEDVRAIFDSSFESARRYVQGINTPSNTVLKLLAEHFEWDLDEIKAMAIRDRERVKHGDLLDVSHGLDPEPQKFVRAWPMLSKSQKRMLLDQLNTYVKAQKAK